VRCVEQFRRLLADETFRFGKLGRVQQFLAGVALITTSIIEPAVWALALNVPISQEHVTGTTEGLRPSMGCCVLGVQVHEDILRNLRVDRCGGSSEVIEVDIEPLTY
jgi:hypothetical protein